MGVLLNLRDVGGLALDGGGHTRRGVLWRSAEPYAGDRPPDRDFEWPPAAVVDLRAEDESAGPHPLAAAGARTHSIPLLTAPLPAAGGDWEHLADLPSAYRFWLAGARVVPVLAVAAHSSGPVLVHCAAGKDRTGIVVAVLLRCAGVSREAIVADYCATAAHLAAVLAARPPGRPSADPTRAQRLRGVDAAAITVVLDELDHHIDGAAGWLVERGAAPADIARWQRRLTGETSTAWYGGHPDQGAPAEREPNGTAQGSADLQAQSARGRLADHRRGGHRRTQYPQAGR